MGIGALLGAFDPWPHQRRGVTVRDTLRRLLVALGGVLLAVYLGSYAVLSRRGCAEADRYRLKGFYYFTPEDSDGWRVRNYACVYLFGPLNAVDRWLGPGRHPASEPLWGLSRPEAAAPDQGRGPR
jgi:hypothetical protein